MALTCKLHIFLFFLKFLNFGYISSSLKIQVINKAWSYVYIFFTIKHFQWVLTFQLLFLPHYYIAQSGLHHYHWCMQRFIFIYSFVSYWLFLIFYFILNFLFKILFPHIYPDYGFLPSTPLCSSSLPLPFRSTAFLSLVSKWTGF